MPVTRGGTISADAENKHKGWYPVFLFHRLRLRGVVGGGGSGGSVILKNLPHHLVGGELELNSECWAFEI